MVTPIDIKYSYRGTEYWVYECAKYLRSHGIDARILVTSNREIDSRVRNSSAVREFASVPQTKIANSTFILPLNFKITTYNNLPTESIVYLPYSIYDYLINLIRKPYGQKYVVGAHSMHLKNGHIVEGHDLLEHLLNGFVKNTIFSRKDAHENIYHHVVNRAQEKYLVELGISKDHIFCIPPFIDVNNFKVVRSFGKKLKVIHIGGAPKGSEVMINVLKNLDKAGGLDPFEFYFVGANQPADLVELSRKHKNVHALGIVDEKLKIDILSRMDVIVIPAVENFPRTMLEGLASGLYPISNTINPAAIEIARLGARVSMADTTEAYVKELFGLTRRKVAGRFDNDKEINRKVSLTFDRNRIMPLMKEMFIQVSAH
jgi:glycosyltransferase involved in cell wall biosynthesis